MDQGIMSSLSAKLLNVNIDGQPRVHVLTRVPFTATLWLAVALNGIVTGTWAHQLSSESLRKWGTALDQIWHGRWWTFVSDTVFVHRPSMYFGILIFIPVSVGVYEWLV